MSVLRGTKCVWFWLLFIHVVPTTPQRQEAAAAASERLKERAYGAKEAAKERLEDVKEGAKEKWAETKEKAEETWEGAKERAGEAWGRTKEKAHETREVCCVGRWGLLLVGPSGYDKCVYMYDSDLPWL